MLEIGLLMDVSNRGWNVVGNRSSGKFIVEVVERVEKAGRKRKEFK